MHKRKLAPIGVAAGALFLFGGGTSPSLANLQSADLNFTSLAEAGLRLVVRFPSTTVLLVLALVMISTSMQASRPGPRHR